MASQTPYIIIYAPAIKDHLRFIERRYHSLFEQVIREQLRFEPQQETRNRKPLLRVLLTGADWELRLGPNNRFRVLYKVDSKKREVNVLGIGIKERNVLLVGGEGVQL